MRASVWIQIDFDHRFGHRTTLVVHLRTDLSKDQRQWFKCGHCPKRYTIKHSLLRHQQGTEPKQFELSVNNATSSSRV